MMTAGWQPDPTGRHEYRYFDGSIWTDNVADKGNPSIDPYVAPSLGPSVQVQMRDSLKKFTTWSDKRMKHAATWTHQRTRKQQSAASDDIRTLDDTGQAAVLGQWSGLASAVTKYAVAVGDVVGGGELLGVLHAISGSEDAQNRLLRSIDAKVDALVKGPYNTGRTHLLEAQRVGVDDPYHVHHIEQAKDCFYLAHGQAASVQSRSLVEYHLGLTWLLLDRREDAIHWLAQSHGSAVAVVNELARQTENIKVLHSQGTTAAAAWFYPAGLVVLGMKFKKMVAVERAQDMLRDYLPFVACASRSHNSLVGASADQLPVLELISTGDDAYELAVGPSD